MFPRRLQYDSSYPENVMNSDESKGRSRQMSLISHLTNTIQTGAVLTRYYNMFDSPASVESHENALILVNQFVAFYRNETIQRLILNYQGDIVIVSQVDHYMYRPAILSDCLAGKRLPKFDGSE